jgi:hypothetical protein
LTLMTSRCRAGYRSAIATRRHRWASRSRRSTRTRPRRSSSGTRPCGLARWRLSRSLWLKRSLTRSRSGRPRRASGGRGRRRTQRCARLRTWRRNGSRCRCRCCRHGGFGRRNRCGRRRFGRNRCRCCCYRWRRRGCGCSRSWSDRCRNRSRSGGHGSRRDGRRCSRCRGSGRSSSRWSYRGPHPCSSRRSFLRIFVRFRLGLRLRFGVGNSPQVRAYFLRDVNRDRT